MYARKVSHKIIDNACILDACRTAQRLVRGGTGGREGTPTDRHPPGASSGQYGQGKNCIKRIDRFIGNEHLFREAYDVYFAFSRLIIKPKGSNQKGQTRLKLSASQ